MERFISVRAHRDIPFLDYVELVQSRDSDLESPENIKLPMESSIIKGFDLDDTDIICKNSGVYLISFNIPGNVEYGYLEFNGKFLDKSKSSNGSKSFIMELKENDRLALCARFSGEISDSLFFALRFS